MTQKLDSNTNCVKTIKFLYSYCGRIIPRSSDGQLRYVGGYTRVLSVDRSITCSELLVKFGEACGSSMNLKCKLPSEDLDVLISIKSDEDLRSVIEEYERAAPEAKIRSVLVPIKSVKKVSPPSSPMSSFDFPSAPKQHVTAPPAARHYVAQRRLASHRCSGPVIGYPVTAGKYRCYEARSTGQQFYPVQHRNHSH